MATPAFKFEIHGLKETMDALEQLPTLSMKRTVVRNALKKAALPVMTDAKANARGIKSYVHEGTHRNVGDEIAKSIKTGRSIKKSQRRSSRDKSAVTMYVGSSHPLAHLFEFGTAERYTKSGAYRGYISCYIRRLSRER
ncbi:MAG: HK97 gp10 family phage protein [Deltaproteobacteria bacterium]|nr:HK97 gp10 family phage protein [Deltaproteobacteria bacterium]